MSIYCCECGKTYSLDTIGTAKLKVYRDSNGNAVTKCTCGKELK